MTATVEIKVVGERIALETLLRDLFAAAALAGYRSDSRWFADSRALSGDWGGDRADLANEAYADADAMLARRAESD